MASIPSFIAKKIKETFRSLLHLENSLGATSSASQLYDGAGNALPVTFSTTNVDISSLSINTNPVIFDFQTAPASVASSHIALYAKSDKHLYIKDSTGTETDLTSTGTTLADGDYGDIVLSSSGTVWTIDSAYTNLLVPKTYQVIAGTGMTGGGALSGNVTLNCSITQYTDEMAQDAVGSILQTTTSITPTYNDGLNTISLVVNDEYVADTVGAMVSGNTETGITVTYQDADNTIDFVVSDLTVAGDTGSTGMTPGDTLTVAGGTNCTSAMSGDTLTINVDDAFLLNTGDVGTGAYDFGGATSLEIPNGTNPTVNVAGQIAVDTDGDGSTIKSGVIKVYDGTQTVYAVMATGYPSSDNDVPAYDSATNRVVWQAQTGSGGGISNVVEDTTPQLGGQLDVNGFAIGDGSLELITFTETASAVNHINITNNSTGNSPKVEAAGDDTNIDLTLDGKGSGVVKTTSSNLDITGNIIVSGTVDGRDIATDGTKLDGIEALADVTDATNVDAAGAVMNSDTSTAAMSFVIDEDNMASDLATKVPTQQSVKAYVDTKVAAYQPLDTDLTTLSTAFTTASASGAASLKFHEDTDNGSNAVTLQGPASTADVTITLPASSGTVALTSDLASYQPLDSTLTSLAAYNTNGILTQTAADTFTGRTITGTANQITVTNGDGVSGNPTLATPQDIATSSSPQFAGVNVGHASDTTITRVSAGDIAVEGNTVYRAGGTDIALSDGGTGASLTDPNADRVMFWDDSAGQVTWLTMGTNLTITGTTLDATGGGGGNSFETISVSGQSDVVADSSTDTLTLAAGTAIGITTNAGTDTITFAVNDAELTAIAGLTSAANKIPMFSGSGTATVIDFLDEDTMTSNSATAVPSQQSVKAYVDANAGGLQLSLAYAISIGSFSN